MATVKRRTWRNANGKVSTAWVVGYQDRAGRWQRVQRPSKAAAEAERVRIEGELARGAHVADRSSVTVAQALQAWLEDFQALVDAGKRERSTLDAYRSLAAHIRAHDIASAKLSRLTPPDCATFARWLEAHRSDEQARRAFKLLRQVLRHGMAVGWCAANATDGVALRVAGDRHDDDLEIPPKAQLRTLVEAAKAHSARAHALVNVALFCGPRVSELLGLRREDVDRHELRVVQRLDRYGRMGPPKSRTSRRTVPMPPGVWGSLAEWMLQAPNSPLVFPSPDGHLGHYPNLRKRLWVPLMASAGLVDGDGRPLFGLHTLRHAAVSLWIEQDVTPKQVSTWAGHSSVAFTMDTYGHLWRSRQSEQAVAAAVEKALVS